MSDLAALITDLKRAVEQANTVGLSRRVTTSQLESLIRKYEDQASHDTSDQPGEWQIRGGNVEAIQHDGSVKQREEIQHWIRVRNGRSTWTQDHGITYIRLDSPRSPNIVGPDWWVVHTADGVFYALSDTEFHIIYIPRETKV